MNVRHISWIVLGVCVIHPSSRAYELNTHRDLTDQAVAITRLSQGTKLKDLGFDRAVDDPGQVLPNYKGDPLSLLRLMTDGAQLEDGIGCLDGRPISHFFNPLNGSGLDIPLFSGTPSPNWAIYGANQSPPSYSFLDARQRFYDGFVKQGKGDRDIALGLMFQTLGHVVHHLQDMAQPQHVRNDSHLDVPKCLLGESLSSYANALIGRPSHYEKWTNRTDILQAVIGAYRDPQSVRYDINGANFKNTFNLPRRFWATGTGDGQGISEFTNRNFVSAGTNFTAIAPGNAAPGFPNPKIEAAALNIVDIQDLCATAFPACPPGLTGKMNFIGSTVEDRFTGQVVANPRASTYSFFSQDLATKGGRLVFALNRFNFEEAHRQLIPRAVAYSAGMINYFFRGDIDLVYDAEQTKYFIKNNGDEDLQGAFELFFDGTDGKRYPILQVDWGSLAIPRHQQLEVQVQFPDSTIARPKDSRDRYILVFHGDMGQETRGIGIGAVAARVIDLAPFVIFKAEMLSDMKSASWADFNLLVSASDESAIHERAIANVSDVVLTINGQAYPAHTVSTGWGQCVGPDDCDRIRGSVGAGGAWEFYLHRSNQFTAPNAGITSPIQATENFEKLYQMVVPPGSVNPTFSWICNFMGVQEANGLTIYFDSPNIVPLSLAFAVRNPADGKLRTLFKFTATNINNSADMFSKNVAISQPSNIRIDGEFAPAVDLTWFPRRLACRVAEG